MTARAAVLATIMVAGEPGIDAAAPPEAITEADLASVFVDAPEVRGRDAFLAGSYADALAAFSAVTSPSIHVRYFRALALARIGRAEAGRELEEVALQYPALGDRCRFQAGAAYETAGDLEAALDQYAAVAKGSFVWRNAVTARAKLLRRKGRLVEAVAALGDLAALPPPPYGIDVGAQALFEVGSIHLVRGDRPAAIAAFTRTWGEHPLAPQAALAWAQLEALGATPGAEVQVGRAERLVESHHNQSGIEALGPLLSGKLPAPLACRARLALGKAQRKERLYFRAVATLKGVARDCSDQAVRVPALFTLASATSVVAPEDAVGVYRGLVAEFPEHALAAEALYSEGEVLLKLGRLSQARKAFLKLAKVFPEAENRAEALFKAFWVNRTLGVPSLGLGHLAAVERDYAAAPDSFDMERARYWRARTFAQQDRLSEALPMFEALARERPTTYYGLLARSRLVELAAQPMSAPTPPSFEGGTLFPLKLGSLGRDARVAAAIELLRLGLRSAAAEELLSLDRSAAVKAGDAEGIRLVVALLSRAGDQRAAQVIARVELRRDFSSAPSRDNVALWRIAYPQAFAPQIEQSCSARGLDPALVRALMREESAFDTRARSWAGAAGLMQLMPATALEAARRLKMGGAMTRERLYDPVLNIELGTETFAGFLKRFRQNVALALAAYNAGGGSVDGWLRSRGDLALDEFVEEIPFAETRGYVRRVLRTYNTYQLLYAGKALTLGQRLMGQEKE